MSAEAQSESLVAKAARELSEKVDRIEVDPRLIVHGWLEAIASMQFPTENQSKVAALIQQLEQPAVRDNPFGSQTCEPLTTSVSKVDVPGVLKRLGWFRDDVMKLMQVQVPKQQTWDEHLEYWCREDRACGWTPRELSLDRLWPFVEGGRNTTDRISGINELCVTMVSGTSLSRQRLGLPPTQKPVTRPSSGPGDMIFTNVGAIR